MRIASVEAFPIRMRRERSQAQGTAGSPTALVEGDFEYRFSPTVNALYSERFETALVRVSMDDGLVGWGEAHSPPTPRVSQALVEDLFAPQLVGQDPLAVEALWDRLYHSMRLRGHNSGFMMEALAGVEARHANPPLELAADARLVREAIERALGDR